MAPLDPAQLTELARSLGAEDDLDALLQQVVDAALTQIEGADHAGVTLLTRTSATTPAATDELVREVDRRQYSLGEGPCLTAAHEEADVVHAPDLATDVRWPRFSAAVAPLGVASMLSFQLFTDTETIGALNIYAGRADPFTDDSISIGSLLAAHAALAAAAQVENAQLRSALQTRDVIGQAKGILMERYKLDAARAFGLLVAMSQHTNTKLRDLAAELAETGELRTSTAGRPPLKVPTTAWDPQTATAPPPLTRDDHGCRDEPSDRS